MKEKKKLATVRLSPDDYEDIANIARDLNRTIPNTIRFMAWTWPSVMVEYGERVMGLRLSSYGMEKTAVYIRCSSLKVPLETILPSDLEMEITAPEIFEFSGGSGISEGKIRFSRCISLFDLRIEERYILIFFGTNHICKINTAGDILN